MILALLLAFQMPAFHLVWIERGEVMQSAEDMTLPECKARQRTFKRRAQAQCIFDVGEREFT